MHNRTKGQRKKINTEHKHNNRGYLTPAELDNVIADVEQLLLAENFKEPIGGQVPLSMPPDLKSILKKPPQRILPTDNPQMPLNMEMFRPEARGYEHGQMERRIIKPKRTKAQQHHEQQQMPNMEMFRHEARGYGQQHGQHGQHGQQHGQQMPNMEMFRPEAQGYRQQHGQQHGQQQMPNMEMMIHPEAHGHHGQLARKKLIPIRTRQQMPPNMEMMIQPAPQGPVPVVHMRPLEQMRRPPDQIIVKKKISPILIKPAGPNLFEPMFGRRSPIIITTESIKNLVSGGFTDAILKIDKEKLSQQQINLFLYYAAIHGHIKIMRLAHRWGANNYIQALIKAIENNQPQAEQLLRKWGAIDYEQMLVDAIENNSTDHANLLKEMGVDYNHALAYAAKDGKLFVMNVLKSWGATDYNSAFIAAIDNGQLDAMKLLHDHWGADDYKWGLVHAAANGQVKAMRKLHEWGANDYDRALISAAEHGKIPAMRLLKKWGATNLDLSLIYAAKAGQLEAIKLLDTWGVTYYDQAITVAMENGQIEAANLLKKLDKINLQVVTVR